MEVRGYREGRRETQRSLAAVYTHEKAVWPSRWRVVSCSVFVVRKERRGLLVFDHDPETPALHIRTDAAGVAVMLKLSAGVFHARTAPLLENLELTRHIQTEGDITQELHYSPPLFYFPTFILHPLTKKVWG